MAVQKFQLAGSPKIHMDRSGGTAVQMFRIAWADVGPFILEMLGPTPYAMPGFPWLTVDNMDIEPHHTEGPDANGADPATYSAAGAKVTLNYTIPKEDGKQQPASNGGDGSGPGGKDGSTGGSAVTFVKHTVSVGGEFLQWPAKGAHWEIGDFKGDDKLSDTTQVGRVVGLIEHQVTWSFVKFPPWDAIRSLIGKINDKKFCGALAGTMLFLGVEAEHEFTSNGAQAWTVTYKFSEKRNVDSFGIIRGWNYFLRPSTGDWEKILIRAGAGSEGIYLEGNFAGLFPVPVP